MRRAARAAHTPTVRRFSLAASKWPGIRVNPIPRKVGANRSEALLADAFKAHQEGDERRAQVLYEQVLAIVPQHPAALQLLGLLARRRGELALAEHLMRKSLEVQPAQPHVWNNLGNLLLGMGRVADGLDCFNRALTQSNRYADAHYNRARALHKLSQLPQAADSVRAALSTSTKPTAAMLQLQSQIEADQGDVKAALASIERAVQLNPDKPALLHNLATLLQREHRPAEALPAHERALSLGLDAADAHYNLGNTLQSLGRLADAVLAYRRALAREPLHRLALYDLARLRWRLGEQEFDAELLQAQAAFPDSAIAPGIRANLLWRAERFADAYTAFGEAQRRAPAPAFLAGMGRSLLRLGQIDAGLAAQQRAIDLDPEDPELHTHWAASLLATRRPEQAEAAAQVALRNRSKDSYAWALVGLAWRMKGDARESWLNDYGRLVSVQDLSPPAGFDTMEAFNEALARELMPLHRDLCAPVDQTLRHGTQTFGDLFEQRHPLVDALKQLIVQAIDRYIASLPQDVGHPFLARRSARWRFTDSWSSRLSSGGHHTNHVHPHGWLSSAYYVTVPTGVRHSATCEGWLQFGAPDFDVGLTDPVVHRVAPKPGRLVLFPSLCWHGTAPFSDAEHRLAIAFDVVPD